MSLKHSERYLIQNCRYPLGSKPTNRLTDIQEIQNYLELMYKHPRNVCKRFQKDISSRTKDIKQFSQLMTQARMHKGKSRAESTRGGSAKNRHFNNVVQNFC